MSGVKIEVRKNTSVLDRILKRLDPNTKEATMNAATDIAQDIRDHWSGHYPPASSPGEPPAIRSGFLDKSTMAIPEQSLRTGKISTTVQATARYASDLEYGTIKMAARPFMRPALKRAKQKFKKYFKLVLAK